MPSNRGDVVPRNGTAVITRRAGVGLHGDSVIVTANLPTILDTEIERSIGKCANMQAVDAALRNTFGL